MVIILPAVVGVNVKIPAALVAVTVILLNEIVGIAVIGRAVVPKLKTKSSPATGVPAGLQTIDPQAVPDT